MIILVQVVTPQKGPSPNVDVPPNPPPLALSPLDNLTILLAHMLRYHPGERDMVILSYQREIVPCVLTRP